MAHLGDFGAAVRELDPRAERDTFSFFGERFEIVDELPPMLVFQLAASMTGKVEETEGLAAMWESLRVSLDQTLDEWTGDGPDPRPEPLRQFNTFYRMAVEKKADLPSLMQLVMSLFQSAGGDRPTVQVSDSQPGQLTTLPSSNTSPSVPPAFGGDPLPAQPPEQEWDRSVPHLVSVSTVLAG
jgi:hypothetical protein